MRDTHPPTRDRGAAPPAGFVPHAGRDLCRDGATTTGPRASACLPLSPYLRHRLVTEDEVLEAVLGASFSAEAAEKFVQEVYWRTYWKGWLEMRPSVWTAYRAACSVALDRVDVEAGLRADWEAACKRRDRDRRLRRLGAGTRETGYLHNHARMWFASIWIFTLRLPWELGADFFLRHLLDGDPASNTLSWRLGRRACRRAAGKHRAPTISPRARAARGQHRARSPPPSMSAASPKVTDTLFASDARAWPHATHGFFRFKDRIPKLAAALKGLNAA
jgi:hypothetical protein